MATYKKIRSLAKLLLEETKVTARRNAGKELLALLSNPTLRRRLASEVAPPAHKRGRVSIQVAQRNALAEVWRYVLQNAVLAAQKTVAKQKSKVTHEEVSLPYELLLRCNKVEEDSGSTPTMGGTARLSRNETKLLTKYCLDMLENEDTFQVAEVKMLEMLAYICSRREFVAYFRPQSEMTVILEEVEKRISSPDDDRSVSHAAREAASKIFRDLIHTASDLGLAVHLILPGCVKMVAGWCASHSEIDVAIKLQALPALFSGIACLLRSDPEQSVAPLTRHGRPIFSLAMRCYGSKIAEGDKRNVFDEYFLSHL
jgi:hypothetical protein